MFEKWKSLCREFTPDKLLSLMRTAAKTFRPAPEDLDDAMLNDGFEKAVQLGFIELSGSQTVFVGAVKVQGELTARSGKKKQYDLAKRILKHSDHDAGIFAFYDDTGRFRFSLVTVTYHGAEKEYSTFRRYTFFVDPELPNKTFLQQMKDAKFSDVSSILETFSIDAISDEFYKEFEQRYHELTNAVQGTSNEVLKEDFALLFAIRIIFLGFVQKKGWLGDNTKFLQDYLSEYRQTGSTDGFYREWLEPLFFDALSSSPGHKPAFENAAFSEETRKALRETPYLNGELFKRKKDVDDKGLWISDEPIKEFFDFLFAYNFTVEENELYDEELELNPEFLGIIFERITNKDQGAVYTPREEVDLMCRLGLVKWLEQKPDVKDAGIDKTDLYRLFFREYGTGEAYDEYQKQGDFSAAQIRVLIKSLEEVTVCDPAAGSGAFEVGMLQVLDQILDNLYSRNNTPEDLKNKAPTPFERKKGIIARSLYGVEVKQWAVWINHLRLWLTLFVEMPNEFRDSNAPLLPNLSFKVRTGDSLVQRIGNKTIPVLGHSMYLNLPPELKQGIKELKQRKADFFYNRQVDYRSIEQQEMELFQAILDYQIEERQNEIRALSESVPEQLQLIATGPEEVRLELSEANKKQIERLKMEIDDLRVQKESLKDERPFIWSIEFSEVFFERGGFDVIIGNPPYLRQAAIRDPYSQLTPSQYKDALREMVRYDFPEYFAKSLERLDQFRPNRQPDSQSDLYTYFYIRSLRLLNRQGVHVFICSNSWLDVDYGAWLQEFFLRRAPLYFVIDNHARRSFARADVNTVITVAGAPFGVGPDHVVRFVAFRQPFKDVVLSDNLLKVERTTAMLSEPSFRISPRTVGELLREGSELIETQEGTQSNFTDLAELQEAPDAGQDSSALYGSLVSKTAAGMLGKYVGDKWNGQYLRAPDIFFSILEKSSDKLTRLGDIAVVRRGYATGANGFFYLEPLGAGEKPGMIRVRNGDGWEGDLEKEFLKPAITSPRDLDEIAIKPEDMKTYIFVCNKSKDELCGTQALEYILWGEERRYHNRSTLRSRSQWWNVGASHKEYVAWARTNAERHNVHINLGVELDNNFFGIKFLNGYEHPGALILVSTFSILTKELYGRSYGGGSGPIKLEGSDLTKMITIDPRHMPKDAVEELYDVVLNASIGTVFAECGIDPKSDTPIFAQEPNPVSYRKAIDDVVFDVLGLSEEERKEVYRAVCQLVWQRISKARSV